jgi:hypothetical protein
MDRYSTRRTSVRSYLVPVLAGSFWIRFHWFRIRIKHFRPNTDPVSDPDPGFNKNWKNLQLKKCDFFYQIATYLFLGLHKRCPSFRRSLQPLRREHQTLHNMKIANFLWVLFVLLDPDPESGSWSTELIESGSNSDLKYCLPSSFLSPTFVRWSINRIFLLWPCPRGFKD